MQNDSPKSSDPLPDSSARGAAAIKQKIPNHIQLIPSAMTASVLVQLKFAAAETPRAVLL